MFLFQMFKYFPEPHNLLCFLCVATYSVLVVESVGLDSLHDLREIVLDTRLTRYPKVDTPLSFSPSISKSEYPISLKSSTLEYFNSKY